MRKRLKKNARGYAWPKGQRVYHATIGARAILREGFKTRAQLGHDVHAAGGGTDAAISLTLSLDVAEAVVLGLRVGHLLARDQLSLGELVIQASQVAPKAFDAALKGLGWPKDPDFVVRVDEGLWPFATGMGYYGGVHLDPRKFEQVMASGEAVYVNELFYEGGKKPYAVTGWAPAEMLAEIDGHRGNLASRYHWDFYKAILGQGDLATNELYDPLFFATNLNKLGEVELDDIAVLEMTVDAEWLCASPRDAEAFGYEPIRYADSQWSESCEGHLDSVARFGKDQFTGYKPRELEEPHPEDTIAYLGAHMQELRAWDVSMLENVRVARDVDDSLSDASVEWFNRRQLEVEDPYYFPYVRMRTPRIVR